MVRKTREGGASGKPTALRPLVLLVDADALSRSRLARALVREGFDVRVALGDFDDAERPRLAIIHLDEQSDNREGILGALLDGYPRVPVMLRAANPAAAAAQAKQLGVQVVQAFLASESFKDVIARAKQMVVGTDHTVPPPAPASEDGSSSFERIMPQALRRVPFLLVSREDVGWFDGDPQEGALLTSIDGHSDLHALSVRCGLDETTALRIIDTLVARGLVGLEEPS
jgi:hypothetical protein